jgi:hypothetical protein
MLTRWIVRSKRTRSSGAACRASSANYSNVHVADQDVGIVFHGPPNSPAAGGFQISRLISDQPPNKQYGKGAT